MEILLDSADPAEIREVARRGLIGGVTTNPGLYASQARGAVLEDRLRELLDASPGCVFTQVIGLHDVDAMVGQARWLASRSERIVVKLPMTREGIDAVIRLKREGPAITVAVTAVASVAQALVAGKAGADVVALFNGPLDTTSDTPVEIVGPVKRIYERSGIGTKVLSCGRFPRGVGEYAAAGSDMVTLRREYLELLYEHPYTDKRLTRFMAEWETAFGGRTWPQA